MNLPSFSHRPSRDRLFSQLSDLTSASLLFVSIPLALSLGGCAEDTILASSENRGIVYDVHAVNHTRVADSYSASNLPANINVSARISGEDTDYFIGDVISRDDKNRWVDQTATRYWPIGKSLDFAGYVNDDGTFKYLNDAEGTRPAFQNYTVPDDAAKQKDLMYAVANGSSNDGSDVSLFFRHALSQVCFDAQNNSTNLDITIKSVGINHLANTGTYKFPITNTTGSAQISDSGVEITSKGEWELSGDYTSSYTIDLGSDGIDLKPAASSGAGEKTGLTTHAEGEDVSKTLALLPQEVKAWDPTNNNKEYDGACIILDVVMKDVSGEGSSLVYEGKVAIPVAINWFEGCRYTYNLIFSHGGNGGYVADPENPTPVLATIGYNVTVDDFTPMPTDNNVDSNVTGSGTQEPENPEEDPRNPLAKFATSNLGSTTTRSGEDSFLLYQWGRNQGYKDWIDAFGEPTLTDNSLASQDGFVVNKNNFFDMAVAISGTGGHDWNNKWLYNQPYHITSVGDFRGSTDKYVMLAFPGTSSYLDYWISALNEGGQEPNANWGVRATACGYSETDPCAEGWRLPTADDFNDIFPTVPTGVSELSLTSLKPEIRNSGDVDYAIAWEMQEDGLLVKCLVLDNATDTPDWTSKDVVSRIFPFTGAIVPLTGTYTDWSNEGKTINYATPYHMTDDPKAAEGTDDNGHFLVKPGVDTGKTFGGYWVSDAKKTFSFTNPADGSGTLRLGDDHPARAYAIRPVKK